MRNTMSVQLNNENSRPSKQRKLITSISLWTLQVVLALMFLFVGGMKLLLPIALLRASMPLPLPDLFVRFIATAEVAGAFGLILPGLLRIRPMLTLLAALGLVLDMIGATAYNLISGQIGAAVTTVVLGLICLAIAYGRRSWAAR
ncbi:MAG TPA: DoxX family protein [Ktedonosporobacter sp.]|nr:DoxX family protein [Ktedonosporobacter sp.]